MAIPQSWAKLSKAEQSWAKLSKAEKSGRFEVESDHNSKFLTWVFYKLDQLSEPSRPLWTMSDQIPGNISSRNSILKFPIFLKKFRKTFLSTYYKLLESVWELGFSSQRWHQVAMVYFWNLFRMSKNFKSPLKLCWILLNRKTFPIFGQLLVTLISTSKIINLHKMSWCTNYSFRNLP